MKQPSRPDEQKLQIFKKTWFFDFDFVSDKLKNPRQDENCRPQELPKRWPRSRIRRKQRKNVAPERAK